MKRYIYTLLLFFVTMMPMLASASLVVDKADSAYMNDDFKQAVELYTQAIDDGGSSTMLYYNLGNSYYRMGKLGNAIVCYERALRLDPTNVDARTNLEFVNSKITDKIGDKGTFISNTFDRIIDYCHSNGWAWIAASSFVLLLFAIAAYIFVPAIVIKKIGFFGAIILLVVSVISNIFAYHAASKATAHNHAIIIEPSVMLSTSPRLPKDRSEEAMLLHEGTKVEIVDSVSVLADSVKMKWYDVKVDNTHRAWISSDAIEKI